MSNKISILGKHVADPNILSPNIINSILWTANDIKYRVKIDCDNFRRYIKEAHVTVLFESVNTFHQSLIHSACNLLQLNPNIIIDKQWSKLPVDTGRFLSIHSDVIITQSQKQINVEKLMKKVKVPVINISSSRYCIPKVLSDLMVIHNHFGYLEGITLSAIGVPCALLSTYLCILPRLKMNIRYMCSDCKNTLVSPFGLDKAKVYCNITKAKLNECYELNDVIKTSNVIALTKVNFDVALNENQLKNANKDCIILPLVSDTCCDGNELLEHKNCKIWKTFEYTKWIYAALIIRVLSDYEHIIKEPTFEKIIIN